MSKQFNICDYSDTDYKEEFWGDGKRAYEDSVERYALRKLFPKNVGVFLEIGAGFGRLLNEYSLNCGKVILMDYAPNLVKQAKQTIKDLGLSHVSAVQGDIYDMDTSIKGPVDGCMMIRVLHHIEDVDRVFSEISRKMTKEGVFIFEYANKRNLLEIFRFFTFSSGMNPFSKKPEKRGESVFYNFHPSYIEHKLAENGFVVEKQLSVSLFRNVYLKKIFGQKFLAVIESILQQPLSVFRLSPSIFIRARKRV